MSNNVLNPEIKRMLISILRRDDIQISYTADGWRTYSIHDKEQPIFKCMYTIEYGDYRDVCVRIYNPKSKQMETVVRYYNMSKFSRCLTEHQKSVIDLIEKVKQRYQVVPEIDSKDSNIIGFLRGHIR